MYKVLIKIIVVVILTLALNPYRLLAATKYVPTPQQLQPPPANVQPNLSGNINYIDSFGQVQDTEKKSDNPENQNTQPETGEVENPQQSFIENIIMLPVQNNTAGKTVWWLIVLGLAGLGTWLVKKKYDKK